MEAVDINDPRFFYKSIGAVRLSDLEKSKSIAGQKKIETKISQVETPVPGKEKTKMLLNSEFNAIADRNEARLSRLEKSHGITTGTLPGKLTHEEKERLSQEASEDALIDSMLVASGDPGHPRKVTRSTDPDEVKEDLLVDQMVSMADPFSEGKHSPAAQNSEDEDTLVNSLLEMAR